MRRVFSFWLFCFSVAFEHLESNPSPGIFLLTNSLSQTRASFSLPVSRSLWQKVKLGSVFLSEFEVRLSVSRWISLSSAAVGVTRHKSKELSRKQSQQLELLESELRKEIRDGRLPTCICRTTRLFYCPSFSFSRLPLNGTSHSTENCLYSRRQLNSRV